MQRGVGAERRHILLSRVVTTTSGDDVDGAAHRLPGFNLALQTHRELGELSAAGVHDVRTHLEVARILRALTIDDARVRGRDEVLLLVLTVGHGLDELPHRLGELPRTDGVPDDGLRVLTLQGREVAHERAVGHVLLGLLVVAAVDSVVGALEQELLAVGDVLATERLLVGTRRGDRGRDVVLRLDLRRGMEVVTEPEEAPAAVGGESDAQHVDLDLLPFEAQRVTGAAVDARHGEVRGPVAAPLRLVEPLHGEDEFLDVVRHRFEPGVVLVGEVVGGREHLDDRTDAALVGEERTLVDVALVDEAVTEIAIDDLLHLHEVLHEVLDVGIASDEGVGDRLRDLRFAATGDGRGLVRLGRYGAGADEGPLLGVDAPVRELDLVAVGADVDVLGAQRDRVLLAVADPRDGGVAHGEGGLLRHEDHVLELGVGCVAFRLHVPQLRVAGDGLLEGVRLAGLRREDPAEVEAREGQCAAGVLLLDEAEEVRRVGDLCLDFLLAVAEVVVGDDGDDDATLVADAQLEGGAAVVELVLVLPALAVSALTLGGVVKVREAEILLLQPREMRREDDGAGVAGPRRGIEGRVVVRQEGVAGVAEDSLDEIEVGKQRRRREEPDLHGALGSEAGHLRHDDGAQQERRPRVGGFFRVGGVGNEQRILRRFHRSREDAGCDLAWDGDLVVLDREATLGNVEDALGGAAIIGRVVKDAVGQTVGGQLFGFEIVPILRQRHRAREARLVEDERALRQQAIPVGASEVVGEEILDAGTDRRQERAAASREFTLLGDDGGDEANPLVIGACGLGAVAKKRKSEADGGCVKWSGHAPILSTPPREGNPTPLELSNAPRVLHPPSTSPHAPHRARLAGRMRRRASN